MISGCMDMALMELPALAIMALMPPSAFFWRSSISFFMTFMLPTMLFRPAVMYRVLSKARIAPPMRR